MAKRKVKSELPELAYGQIWLTRRQVHKWCVLRGRGYDSQGWFVTSERPLTDQLVNADPYSNRYVNRGTYYSRRGITELDMDDLITLVYEGLVWPAR
jgi:hypothetical protein